jgi:hypothetical protein
MWPAFPAVDYSEGSVNLRSIGDTLPWHLYKPSPVHMLGSAGGYLLSSGHAGRAFEEPCSITTM